MLDFIQQEKDIYNDLIKNPNLNDFEKVCKSISKYFIYILMNSIK